MDRLRIAMVVTFLALGIVLSTIFWGLMWYFDASGPYLAIFTFGFVGVMVFFQWLIGPSVIKAMSRMKECTNHEILHMVQEISRKSGVPAPKAYVVESPVPNAFAFGRTRKSSAIALHTGLISMLTREELRGVIAHEIGHIKNRDVIVMTLASALPMIMFYLVYFGAMSGDRRNGGNFMIGWIGGMLAQLVGTVIVLYLSRVREYYADAHAAKAIGDPMPLAHALAKISYGMKSIQKRYGPMKSSSMNAFYIEDPAIAYRENLEKERGRGIMEIFMTHPPTYKRIRALEKLR